MNRRFYAPKLGSQDSTELEGPEAHHLIHVLRVRPGEEVTFFDGAGREGRATVEHVGRNSVRLRADSRELISREPSLHLAVASALPKGGRDKFLVEKCTELGVAELIALETQRSVGKVTDAWLGKARRWVIEACKQCGRNELMAIRAARLDELVASDTLPSAKFIAVPGPAGDIVTPPRDHAIVLIGPEGGFAADEVESATRHGWRAWRLGSRILRIETAAIAAAARWLCD